MKILMLVNWKVKYCEEIPPDKQPPDYDVKGEPYWFFRYFREKHDVDVVDISSFPWLERFEKETIRFYIWQTLKVLPNLGKYDMIISHGMQSGAMLSLWRRFFPTKAKHVVFDVGSFNSAAETGMALKLMQFSSKSIDGLIYHTSSQLGYYERFFPWIVPKSRFIRFGTDLDFFSIPEQTAYENTQEYMICVGYAKRDWDTVVRAYQQLDTPVKLRLVGHVEERYRKISGVEQIPFIPIHDLICQICGARLAVLPLESFNYSYGQMTLMQQMALEKCVVAARVPSLVDYINDATAILYTPGDEKDLAHKLEQVLEDPSLREAIGRNGRRWLMESCNERTMAEEIEQYIQEINMLF